MLILFFKLYINVQYCIFSAHMNGGFKSDSLGKQSSLGSSYQNQFESIPQKRDSLPDTLHEPEPQHQQRRVDYDNVNEDADIRL